MHLFDLPQEHPPFDNIIVELVKVGDSRELGSRDFAERMEVEPIDGSNDEAHNYPAKGEQ